MHFNTIQSVNISNILLTNSIETKIKSSNCVQLLRNSVSIDIVNAVSPFVIVKPDNSIEPPRPEEQRNVESIDRKVLHDAARN